MRVGIDATIIRGSRISGIERYVIELVNTLSHVNQQDSFEVYCHSKGIEHFRDLPSNFQLKISPFKNRILTEQIWLPLVCNLSKVDLVHLTTLAPSWLINRKSVITVHDAVPWKFVQTLSNGMKYYNKPILTKYIQMKKPSVITVSDCSKHDLMEKFKLENETISVIYNGKSPKFKPMQKELRTEHPHGFDISKPYILTLGTIEPRKNIQSLIFAYSKISDHINENLFLVGRKGWKDQLEIPEHIKDRIIFTGFIDDDVLVSLLSGASAFIFPSFYEGFGLPVIEAQSCGVPTVISNTSSLPEIAGGAAMFFNPRNVDEIGERIVEILTNQLVKQKLIEDGLINALKFSWHNTAKDTNKLYQALSNV